MSEFEAGQDEAALSAVEESASVAMAELGSVLRTSAVHSALGKKALLSELELHEEHEQHTHELWKQLEAV